MYGSGGTIHIKKANRGKFTAYKARTGKTTAEALHSSNPHVRQMANFARNAKKWHHAQGGWIQEYADGGRAINPVTGGLMIGGQHAYPPTVQYPPEYGFGGVLQGVAPFLNLAIPGAGSALGMVGGLLEGQSKQKEQEEAQAEQIRQMGLAQATRGQAGLQGNGRPTFAWGGRLPENNSFSPSGLTMGHVPGYDDNTNPTIPPKGFSFRTNTVGRKGEIKNWSQDTMANVMRHAYAMGGEVPVELEKQEVFQEPNGEMGQVDGPSHAEGGVPMQLPEESFVWSDKLKTAKGTTFADEAAKLARMKAKYEKILKA
jgi:hypothetical protein